MYVVQKNLRGYFLPNFLALFIPLVLYLWYLITLCLTAWYFVSCSFLFHVFWVPGKDYSLKLNAQAKLFFEVMRLTEEKFRCGFGNTKKCDAYYADRVRELK